MSLKIAFGQTHFSPTLTNLIMFSCRILDKISTSEENVFMAFLSSRLTRSEVAVKRIESSRCGYEPPPALPPSAALALRLTPNAFA